MCSISLSVKTGIEGKVEDIKLRKGRELEKDVGGKGGGGRRSGRKVDAGSVLEVMQHYRSEGFRLRRSNIWVDEARWMCGSFRDFEDLLNGFVNDAMGEMGMFCGNVGFGVQELDVGGDKTVRGEGLIVNRHFEGVNGISKCECYYFFGQVLGIALRNGVALPGLALNRVIWKVMAGVVVGREDLYLFDSRGAMVADIMAQVENLGVDDDDSFVNLFGGGIKRGGVEEGVGTGKGRSSFNNSFKGNGDAVSVAEAQELACRIRRAGFLSIARQIQAMYSGIVNVIPACGLVMYSSDSLQDVFRSGCGRGC
jgi:hypothetical protein